MHAVADLDTADAPQQARELLSELPPRGVLNVAGPRESGAPGIYGRARALLAELLAGEDTA